MHPEFDHRLGFQFATHDWDHEQNYSCSRYSIALAIKCLFAYHVEGVLDKNDCYYFYWSFQNVFALDFCVQTQSEGGGGWVGWGLGLGGGRVGTNSRNLSIILKLKTYLISTSRDVIYSASNN